VLGPATVALRGGRVGAEGSRFSELGGEILLPDEVGGSGGGPFNLGDSCRLAAAEGFASDVFSSRPSSKLKAGGLRVGRLPPLTDSGGGGGFRFLSRWKGSAAAAS